LSQKRGPVQNVFDIQQGVAIGLFVKTARPGPEKVYHADLQGDRDSKYHALALSKVSDRHHTMVKPVSPFYLFVPTDVTYQAEYNAGWKVTDIFTLHHCGIITKRDSLTIHLTADDAFRTVCDFAVLSPDAAREKYQLPSDVRDWKVVWAQADLREAGLSKGRVIPVLYRPFDVRFTYFTGRSRGFVGWPVADVTRVMLRGDNVALVTTRMTKGESFAHCLVSRHMVEVICLSSKTSNNAFVFPLYEGQGSGRGDLFEGGKREREPNLRAGFCGRLAEQLGCEYVRSGRGDGVRSFGAEDVFGWIVALLHSAAYRERYVGFLSRDFPRVLLPRSVELFREVSRIGRELVAVELMESPECDGLVTAYRGPKDPEVVRVGWSDDTVWLDAGRTSAREGHLATVPGAIGFKGVPKEVWDFLVGGYRVCHKWLDERKGFTLSEDDVSHYLKIVGAIWGTIRLTEEIDVVIERHGGWPGAFQTGRASEELAERVLKVTGPRAEHRAGSGRGNKRQ